MKPPLRPRPAGHVWMKAPLGRGRALPGTIAWVTGPDDARELDLVLHGATGFVGRLTAGYLAAHAPSDVRIGLSGRSPERLRQVRDELGPAAAGWPLLVADSASADDLAALAARTRVVATTVGPYARHGLPLVQACAQAGTHYADLTGEVLFVHESIDRYDATARATKPWAVVAFKGAPGSKAEAENPTSGYVTSQGVGVRG